MPVTIKCDCGHRMVRPTNAHRKNGTRCAKCNAIILRVVKVEKAKPAPVKLPRRARNDKGGRHNVGPKVSPKLSVSVLIAPTESAKPAPKSIPPIVQADTQAHTYHGPPVIIGEEADTGPSLAELFGPLDPDLDDPDSARHLGAVG